MGEEVEDERGDIGEEKVRSGIHAIEVGFKLLEVLINKPHAMARFGTALQTRQLCAADGPWRDSCAWTA
jgi:hypothetical protein